MDKIYVLHTNMRTLCAKYITCTYKRPQPRGAGGIFTYSLYIIYTYIILEYENVYNTNCV